MADGTIPGAGYTMVEAKQGKAPVPWPAPDMTLATARAARAFCRDSTCFSPPLVHTVAKPRGSR